MATAAWAPSGPPFFGIGIDYECATDISELRKNLQDAAGESENGHVIVHFTAALSNDVKWCPDCVKADPVLRKELTGRANDIVCVTVTRDEWLNTPGKQHPYRSLLGVQGVPCLKVFTVKQIEAMGDVDVLQSKASLPCDQCADPDAVRTFLGKYWPTVLMYSGVHVWSHSGEWYKKPIDPEEPAPVTRMVSLFTNVINVMPMDGAQGRPRKIFTDRVLSAEIIYPDSYSPTGEPDPTQGDGFSIWAWGEAPGYPANLWHRHDFYFRKSDRAVLHFIWAILQKVNKVFGEHNENKLKMRHGVGRTAAEALANKRSGKQVHDGFAYMINTRYFLLFKRPPAEVKREGRLPKKNLAILILPVPLFANSPESDWAVLPVAEQMRSHPFVKMNFRMNSGSIVFPLNGRIETVEAGPFKLVSTVNAELDAARAYHIKWIRDTIDQEETSKSSSKMRALLSMWSTNSNLRAWALQQPFSCDESPHPVGFNALARAVVKKRSKIVKSLLQNGAEAWQSVSAGRKSRSLLHLAVLQNDATTVKVLLEQKANPRTKDPQGRSALDLARILQRTDKQDNNMSVLELLDAGAEPDHDVL